MRGGVPTPLPGLSSLTPSLAPPPLHTLHEHGPTPGPHALTLVGPMARMTSPSPRTIDESLSWRLSGAQIACHHFVHGCFLPGTRGALPELKASRASLATVPCAIVHGRHDVICPPRAAHQLQAAWPNATLRIVESGAHALFEKPMRAAAQACLAELHDRELHDSSEESGRKRRRD